MPIDRSFGGVLPMVGTNDGVPRTMPKSAAVLLPGYCAISSAACHVLAGVARPVTAGGLGFENSVVEGGLVFERGLKPGPTISARVLIRSAAPEPLPPVVVDRAEPVVVSTM